MRVPKVSKVSKEEVLRRAGIEVFTTERIGERKLRWYRVMLRRWRRRLSQAEYPNGTTSRGREGARVAQEMLGGPAGGGVLSFPYLYDQNPFDNIGK